MSNTIKIGENLDGGGQIKLDVGSLLTTKLLVTANSGGGKSYLQRLLFEGIGRSTQLIVLDVEGEFITLREQLDMVLVGPQGEIPTDLRSAALLTRRLMEKELSAVIDLSELKYADRKRYVRVFAETMIDLPKTLWRPCFVGIDETHQFCPEKGQGDAESAEAVLNLFTLSRKRGFCPIAATQRISALHKGVAAECNNKFIGRTTLDVDLKRAAFELGLSGKDVITLRELKPGEFHCYGPSLSHDGVARLKVGAVTTTHPKAGQGRTLKPPAPSSTITDALKELNDLPKEAEAEAKDLAGARKRIAELEKLYGKFNPAKLPPSLREAQTANELAAARQTIAKLRKGLEDAMKVIAEVHAKGFEATSVEPAEIERAVKAAAQQIVKLADQKLTQRQAEFDRWKKEATKVLAQLQKLINDDVTVRVEVKHNEPFTMTAPERPVATRPAAAPPAEGLTAPQQAILDTVLMLDTRGITVNRDCVARWIGIHPNGGSFGANLGTLRSEGYLDGFKLTDKGAAAAREQETGVEGAMRALDGEPKRQILRVLMEEGAPLSREGLADKLGIHPNGGSYGANLGWLRTMGLLTERGPINVTEGLMR